MKRNITDRWLKSKKAKRYSLGQIGRWLRREGVFDHRSQSFSFKHPLQTGRPSSATSARQIP